MSDKRLYCDIKLEVSIMEKASIERIVAETIADGFKAICLCQTINIHQKYHRLELNLNYPKNEVLLLYRVNLHLTNEADFKQLKNKNAELAKADLVSVSFDNSSLLEHFLKLHPEFHDNLIFIDLKTFQLVPQVLKLIKPTSYFLEFGYADVLAPATRKQALMTMYKLLDSMIKRIIMSSNATTALDRRAPHDLMDFVMGITENSKAKSASLLNKLIVDNPVDLLKQVKLRREGLISQI